MDNQQRLMNYFRQNRSKKLTPSQKRRMFGKFRRWLKAKEIREGRLRKGELMSKR